MGEPTGNETTGRILDIADEPKACARNKLEPHEGVCRLDNFREYASEEGRLNVWANHPAR